MRHSHVLQKTWVLPAAVVQMFKPEEKVEQVKGCAAQLDAGALVAIVSHEPVYEGLRDSLQDIWLGHKEDPHKVLDGHEPSSSLVPNYFALAEFLVRYAVQCFPRVGHRQRMTVLL